MNQVFIYPLAQPVQPKRPKPNRTRLFCHLCPSIKGFAQLSNLKRHLEAQHEGADLPDTPFQPELPSGPSGTSTQSIADDTELPARPPSRRRAPPSATVTSTQAPEELPAPSETQTSKKGRERRAFFSLPTAPKSKRTRSAADTEKPQGKCVPP